MTELLGTYSHKGTDLACKVHEYYETIVQKGITTYRVKVTLYNKKNGIAYVLKQEATLPKHFFDWNYKID